MMCRCPAKRSSGRSLGADHLSSANPFCHAAQRPVTNSSTTEDTEDPEEHVSRRTTARHACKRVRIASRAMRGAVGAHVSKIQEWIVTELLVFLRRGSQSPSAGFAGRLATLSVTAL